jgi:hypothetical protein
MTPTPSQSRQPVFSPAAQPRPLNLAGAFNKQPLESNTPDATPGGAAKRPQTQQRRGLAPWSAPREADHPLTTLATR